MAPASPPVPGTSGGSSTITVIPARRASAASRPRRSANARRQIDDQQVNRSTGQQRARDREALVGIGRGDDDEPLRLDPAGHDLDRVERDGEIQPGDDRAAGLRRRGEPQRERGPAARGVAAQGHAHAPRHAAGAENGIEVGEAGRENAIRIVLWKGRRLVERHRGQGADHISGVARRGGAPARSQSRKSRVQVPVRSGHRPDSIEQTFE
jgi:hypothetical protein